MEKYSFIRELGVGEYGSVWLCMVNSTKKMVAVKRFKESHCSDQIMAMAMREIRMLKKAQHRNVIKLLEAFRSKSGRVYLVMEYVDRTLTSDIYSNGNGLPLAQVKLFMWQLCQAVRYLHHIKVVHRDLKPANILVSSSGIIKLCDFGFARTLNPQKTSNYSAYVVTRWYRPPEVVVKDRYGPPIDIWALGCIFAEMVTGRALLPGKNAVHQLNLTMGLLGPLSEQQTRLMQMDRHMRQLRVPDAGEVPTLQARFPTFNPEMLQFLSACLQADPARRMTAEQLLALPFFNDVWDMLPRLAAMNPEHYGPGPGRYVPPISARRAFRHTTAGPNQHTKRDRGQSAVRRQTTRQHHSDSALMPLVAWPTSHRHNSNPPLNGEDLSGALLRQASSKALSSEHNTNTTTTTSTATGASLHHAAGRRGSFHAAGHNAIVVPSGSVTAAAVVAAAAAAAANVTAASAADAAIASLTAASGDSDPRPIVSASHAAAIPALSQASSEPSTSTNGGVSMTDAVSTGDNVAARRVAALAERIAAVGPQSLDDKPVKTSPLGRPPVADGDTDSFGEEYTGCVGYFEVSATRRSGTGQSEGQQQRNSCGDEPAQFTSTFALRRRTSDNLSTSPAALMRAASAAAAATAAAAAARSSGEDSRPVTRLLHVASADPPPPRRDSVAAALLLVPMPVDGLLLRGSQPSASSTPAPPLPKPSSRGAEAAATALHAALAKGPEAPVALAAVPHAAVPHAPVPLVPTVLPLVRDSSVTLEVTHVESVGTPMLMQAPTPESRNVARLHSSVGPAALAGNVVVPHQYTGSAGQHYIGMAAGQQDDGTAAAGQQCTAVAGQLYISSPLGSVQEGGSSRQDTSCSRELQAGPNALHVVEVVGPPGGSRAVSATSPSPPQLRVSGVLPPPLRNRLRRSDTWKSQTSSAAGCCLTPRPGPASTGSSTALPHATHSGFLSLHGASLVTCFRPSASTQQHMHEDPVTPSARSFTATPAAGALGGGGGGVARGLLAASLMVAGGIGGAASGTDGNAVMPHSAMFWQAHSAAAGPSAASASVPYKSEDMGPLSSGFGDDDYTVQDPTPSDARSTTSDLAPDRSPTSADFPEDGAYGEAERFSTRGGAGRGGGSGADGGGGGSSTAAADGATGRRDAESRGVFSRVAEALRLRLERLLEPPTALCSCSTASEVKHE